MKNIVLVPWGLCGWRGLGGRVTSPEARWLQRQHSSESDNIVGDEVAVQANSCNADGPYKFLVAIPKGEASQ